MVKDCYSKGKCYTYQGKHHISVYTGNKVDTNKKENENESVNLLTNNELNSVLFMTARAQAYSLDNKKVANVRILFDSGSQLSYVTPRARSIIDLKTIGKKDMCVKTFGGAKQKKSTDLVQFSIKTENGHVPVKALVSEISYPLRNQNLSHAKKNYEHLKGLKLADSNDDNQPLDVDILIGSDLYWEFIDASVIKRGNQVIL